MQAAYLLPFKIWARQGYRSLLYTHLNTVLLWPPKSLVNLNKVGIWKPYVFSFWMVKKWLICKWSRSWMVSKIQNPIQNGHHLQFDNRKPDYLVWILNGLDYFGQHLRFLPIKSHLQKFQILKLPDFKWMVFRLPLWLSFVYLSWQVFYTLPICEKTICSINTSNNR